MKKTLLSISALMFTAMLINAQTVDLTTYRGAFAPAPTRQWTENWTNFNAQNTAYPTATITRFFADSITTNTTWTSNNTYLLDSILYVSNNATLTIEPGTVIRGRATNSALIVTRGAKVIAEGTPCSPIVFTTDNAPGTRAAGQWGGVILLGKAKHNLGTSNLIEGLPNTDQRNFHGGTDDDDNSGVLKYVRIEYTGFIFSANNEINGLTMGSVGRGTTIDYVQVSHGDDDAFEWFGGSVNCKHLVAFRNKDDDFDTDNGFSGTIQYGLSIKDRNFSDASQSEGFESDNSATGVNGPLPKTSCSFYNITQIGGFPCASNAAGSGVAPSTSFLHRRGARIRRNSDHKIYNSILMNNWRGLFVDDAIVAGNLTAPTTVNFNEDSAVFRNNIIAGDFTTTWTGTTYNGTKSLAFENPATRLIGLNANYAIDSVNTCSLLTDAWNANPVLADFRPNTAGDGAVVTDPTNLNSGVDMSPGILISGNLLTSNQTKGIGLNIFEGGGGASNGATVLTISKLSGYTITVPGLTLTSVNQSGTNGTNAEGDYTNGDWNFRDDGVNIIATSKPGIVIPKFGFVQLGFNVTRPVTTPAGTSQNLSVTLSGGTDATPLNNGALQALGTN